MPQFEEGYAYCFAGGRLVHQYFLFIFFEEGAHIELKFSIQIYHYNI